jgi:pimeloyl-ACP methyl ester carboxylesterase
MATVLRAARGINQSLQAAGLDAGAARRRWTAAQESLSARSNRGTTRPRMSESRAAIGVVGWSSPDFPAWLLTTLAAGVDSVVVRTARLVVDRALMPTPEEADALRASAGFYAPFADDPRRFFAFLDEPAAPPEATVVATQPIDGNGERASATFASAYRPVNPAYAAEYGSFTENHLVHVEHWHHRDARPRTTVIALHGFGMGQPAFDAVALMAPALFAAGLDVALMTLPLHGARAPRTTRFSGQLFAHPSVPRINESIAQAIHDVAGVTALLRERSAGPVGVMGLSLGGYVAALAAALMGELAFAIPIVAPACFGDLAHRFMAASRLYRGHEERALTREEFRAAYRVHSPLAHRPRMPTDRVLILAARGDRVVPAEHAAWLWEHWGGPRLAWFTGSHLVPFGRGDVRREILDFLARRGLLASGGSRRRAERAAPVVDQKRGT